MELRRENVIRKVGFVVLMLATAASCFGQARKQKTAGLTSRISQPLIKSNKPPVFVTFLKQARVEPQKGLDDPNPNYLFFKLTNNTRWPIWLDMSGTPDDDIRYGDATLYTQIEDSSSGNRISGKLFCHVCSFNPLGAGRSMTFSVPIEDSVVNATMRIRYEFNWEQVSTPDSKNLHTVAFFFGDLPQSIIAGLPSRQ
jgi:hypothetical protein